MASVRVGALEIAYHDAGAGDPVVLVNGTGESGATWVLQVERLSTRRRCIAIDSRDTGDSSYVDASYTPADIAGDVAGVIDGLGLGACHVVGYSLGGAAAQELALRRPDLVRSLVLVATWPATDGWFAAQMRSWQSLRRAHWDDEEAFLDALAPWLYAPQTFSEGRVDELSHLADRIGETPQRPEGWIRQCDADIAHDAGERLRAIAAPTLVVVGTEDICTPPRYARALCDLIPGARLVTVEAAGHALPLERPDELNDAIEGFLDQR